MLGEVVNQAVVHAALVGEASAPIEAWVSTCGWRLGTSAHRWLSVMMGSACAAQSDSWQAHVACGMALPREGHGSLEEVEVS